MPWNERRIRAIEAGSAELPDADAVIELIEGMVKLMRGARIVGFRQPDEPRYRLLWRTLETVARGRLGLIYDAPPRSLRRWADAFEPRGASLVVDFEVRDEFASLQGALNELEEIAERTDTIAHYSSSTEASGVLGSAVRRAVARPGVPPSKPMASHLADGGRTRDSSEPLIPLGAPARDAFISYSHKDKALAQRLVSELAGHNISCWIDEGELLVGDSLIQRICEAIEKAEFFIALVSEHSVGSRWCQRELGQAAVEELQAQSGVKVLPVRVGNVQMPPSLTDRVWGPDPRECSKSAAQQLATSIRGHRIRRAEASAVGEGVADGPAHESRHAARPTGATSVGSKSRLAEPGQRSVDSTRTVPHTTSSSSPTRRAALSSLIAAAAIQLVADQFDDGAWARSLWRHGGAKFTNDVSGEPQTSASPARATGPAERRAISVSSWAGVALMRTFGAKAGPLVAPTVEYVMGYYDDAAGSFGCVHAGVSSTPLVAPHRGFLPNPRHAASAMKLLYYTGRHPRAMARALSFLVLRSQNENGSWSESLADTTGNTLTTAYVLDALLAVRDDIAIFGTALDLAELRAIQNRFELGVSAGVDWLARHQSGQDGSWGYRVHGDDPMLRPYYTAHVVAFLPQLMTRYETVMEGALEYLHGQRIDGGFPETVGGLPGLAPTAMIAIGLARVDHPQARPLLDGALDYLAQAVNRQGMPALHVFASTFVVLLGQTDDICPMGWRDETWRGIERLVEARQTGCDASVVVQRTVAGLSNSLKGLEKPLHQVLLGDV